MDLSLSLNETYLRLLQACLRPVSDLPGEHCKLSRVLRPTETLGKGLAINITVKWKVNKHTVSHSQRILKGI